MTKLQIARNLKNGNFDKVNFFATNTRKGWDFEPTGSQTSASHDEDYLGCMTYTQAYEMTQKEIVERINEIIGA
jgi:hypothetical protein